MGGSGFQLAPNEILNRFIQGTQEREELEQRQKENQYKQDMIELHHKEIDASVKHLNNLTEVARQNLKDQVADRIGQGRIPGAFAQGIPQGAAQPQTPGQIPTQARTLPNGIQVPAVPGTQSPTQDLGPAQQVPIGYTDPSTGVSLRPDEYTSPQQQLAQEAQRVRTLGSAKAQEAGQTTAAEEAAKQPYILKNMEAMQSFKEKTDIRDRASMERIAAGNNITNLKGHQLNYAASKYRTDAEFGATPGEIKEVGQRVANGESLQDLRKEYSKGVINAFEKTNTMPDGPHIYPLSKDQHISLNTIGTLFATGGPVDKMEAFTQHYSADTQLGATVKKLLLHPEAKLSEHEAAIMSEYESMKAEYVKAGQVLLGDKNFRNMTAIEKQGKGVFPDVQYDTNINMKRTQDFKREAVGIFKNTMKGVPDPELQRYAALNNVPLNVATVNKTSGPTVGTIEGGYKFKGGNPALQSNWEKQ